MRSCRRLTAFVETAFSVLAAAFVWSAVVSTTAYSVAGPIEYVIQVSVDGLRGDLLKNLVAGAPAAYPNFARLQAQSAYTYNARSDFDNTETIPNHASMLTGRPVVNPAGGPNTVAHGYTDNSPGVGDTLHAQGNPNVPYKASVFDVVHDNGLSTELLASKTKFQVYDTSYNATYGALDLIGADNGRDKIDFTQLVDTSSASVTTKLVDNMNASLYRYSFLHIVEPDIAGHSGGWGNAAWNNSVAVVDARLGQIFQLIDANAALSGHTAILLSADHGGGVPATGHTTASAPESYTIPMFIWGAGLPAGSNLYDAFANRFDPLATRPDYNAAQQPLRDGDTGNISLALLGLAPIPGSLMRPTFGFAGDADGNRVVDFTDLGILLNNYDQPGNFAAGDFNKSGTVDFTDLGLLLNNYDQTSPLSLNLAPVPEPATFSLLACGVLGILIAVRCWR